MNRTQARTLDCQSVNESLPAYVERELPAEAARAVERHLRECGACRRACEEVRTVISGLRDLAAPDPGPAFWERFPRETLTAYQVEQERSSMSAVWRRIVRRWREAIWVPRLAYLAVVGMILGLTLMLMRAPPVTPDSYTFQAPLQARHNLAHLARGITDAAPPLHAWGFAARPEAPAFFAVGTLYSQCLAYTLGGDSVRAGAALDRIAGLLGAAEAATLAGLKQRLAAASSPTAGIARLRALEGELRARAADAGERQRRLFDAGRAVMDLRLAVAARDPDWRDARGRVAALERELRAADVPPGAVQAAGELAALLDAGAPSGPATERAQGLLARIQALLS